MSEFLIKRFRTGPSCPRFPITLMNKSHHVVERCARKKNLVHAFASHDCRIVVRDGAASSSENLDVVSAFFAQEIDNCREKFDMPAVVTRDTNSAHVLLDRRAHDISDGAVIS